jgi:hypothetical protein
MPSPPTLCALTMVYNEARNLPRWLAYYSAQLGAENCIVVDHGSDDGATTGLGHPTGRIGLPRDRPFGDIPRAAFLSGLASALLQYYDGVLYTDVDEFVVADPLRYDSLLDFFERNPSHATAIGFDIVHRFDHEPPLKADRGLLEQRAHVHFNEAMCKTSLVTTPVRWGGGFHTSSLRPRFSGVYLFHAKTADIEAHLARVAITRRIPMPGPGRGAEHWRFADEEIVRRAQHLQGLPVEEWTAETRDRAIEDLAGRVFGGHGSRARYGFDGRPPHWLTAVLFTLPPEFARVV